MEAGFFWSRIGVPLIIPIGLTAIYLCMNSITNQNYLRIGIILRRIFDPLALIYFTLVSSIYSTYLFMEKGIPPFTPELFAGFGICLVTFGLHLLLVLEKFSHPEDRIPDPRGWTVGVSMFLALSAVALLYQSQGIEIL